MAKRKKHPKLPNGYGQIRYLGKNRRNPYGVYPAATEVDDLGRPKTPQAICYVPDWLTGFMVLTSYRAGTYTPGDERSISISPENSKDLVFVVEKLLSDYNQAQGIESEEPEEKGKTFQEIFEEYYLDKFKMEYNHKGKKRSTEQSMTAAFKNCKELHNREFSSLVANDLQAVVDNCPLKHSSIELIIILYHQMYRYARKNNLCDKDYSEFVENTKADDDEHGVPFTDQELHILWENQDNQIVEMLLIMCYSGFRISAYRDIKIDLKKMSFQGGVKTKAGKNRIVPIHSCIRNLVKRRLNRSGSLLDVPTGSFRKSMYATLNDLGMERHTPHDCRHTFSRLCEKYNVNENDRKRMLGHSFGNDITNGVYGHRELEDLRAEIEKIKVL